jgi:hypothetical protein
MDNYTQAKTRVLWEKICSRHEGVARRRFPYSADNDESGRLSVRVCVLPAEPPPPTHPDGQPPLSSTCRRSLALGNVIPGEVKNMGPDHYN